MSKGAQIIVLPELANSGYVFASLEEAKARAEPADGQLLAAWAEEAARGGAIVVGGLCEAGENGRLYNSAALVDGNGPRAVYRKIHLWDREVEWFAPGETQAPVVETPYGLIGLAICHDFEFPELSRGLALAGCQLIAVPTNWPRLVATPNEEALMSSSPADGSPMMATLASATAFVNRVFVAVCDRTGIERGVEWEGASVIAAPDGRLAAGPVTTGAVTTLQADIELGEAREKRTGPRNDVFADRRPELYAPHR